LFLSNTGELIVTPVERLVLAGTLSSNILNIELSKKYQQNGYAGIESKHLNAHNQFLQTSAAIGFLGMLVLFLLLLIPFIQSLISKDFVFAGFLFITFSNAWVEGILEAQAGVIFFAFFYSLFLRNAKSN
jgi:O-antigen ligase